MKFSLDPPSARMRGVPAHDDAGTASRVATERISHTFRCPIHVASREEVAMPHFHSLVMATAIVWLSSVNLTAAQDDNPFGDPRRVPEKSQRAKRAVRRRFATPASCESQAMAGANRRYPAARPASLLKSGACSESAAGEKSLPPGSNEVCEPVQ